jgi:FtsH-binding integral membrane protein
MNKMENRSTVTRSQSTTMDVGLRAHMGRVYNRMTLGVLVTALTAALVASSPALMKFFSGRPADVYRGLSRRWRSSGSALILRG